MNPSKFPKKIKLTISRSANQAGAIFVSQPPPAWFQAKCRQAKLPAKIESLTRRFYLKAAFCPGGLNIGAIHTAEHEYFSSLVPLVDIDALTAAARLAEALQIETATFAAGFVGHRNLIAIVWFPRELAQAVRRDNSRLPEEW